MRGGAQRAAEDVAGVGRIGGAEGEHVAGAVEGDGFRGGVEEEMIGTTEQWVDFIFSIDRGCDWVGGDSPALAICAAILKLAEQDRACGRLDVMGDLKGNTYLQAENE